MITVAQKLKDQNIKTLEGKAMSKSLTVENVGDSASMASVGTPVGPSVGQKRPYNQSAEDCFEDWRAKSSFFMDFPDCYGSTLATTSTTAARKSTTTAARKSAAASTTTSTPATATTTSAAAVMKELLELHQVMPQFERHCQARVVAAVLAVEPRFESREEVVARLALKATFAEVVKPFLDASFKVGATTQFSGKDLAERVQPQGGVGPSNLVSEILARRDLLLPIASMANQHPRALRNRYPLAETTQNTDRVRNIVNASLLADPANPRNALARLRVTPDDLPLLLQHPLSDGCAVSFFAIKLPVLFTSLRRLFPKGKAEAEDEAEDEDEDEDPEEGRGWGVITSVTPDSSGTGAGKKPSVFRGVFADQSTVAPGVATFKLESFAVSKDTWASQFLMQPFPKEFPAFWITFEKARHLGAYFVGPNDDVPFVDEAQAARGWYLRSASFAEHDHAVAGPPRPSRKADSPFKSLLSPKMFLPCDGISFQKSFEKPGAPSPDAEGATERWNHVRASTLPCNKDADITFCSEERRKAFVVTYNTLIKKLKPVAEPR